MTWLEAFHPPGADIQLERMAGPAGRRGLHRQLALAAQTRPLLHAAGPAEELAEHGERQRPAREGPPGPAFSEHALQVALDAEGIETEPRRAGIALDAFGDGYRRALRRSNRPAPSGPDIARRGVDMWKNPAAGFQPAQASRAAAGPAGAREARSSRVASTSLANLAEVTPNRARISAGERQSSKN